MVLRPFKVDQLRYIQKRAVASLLHFSLFAKCFFSYCILLFVLLCIFFFSLIITHWFFVQRRLIQSFFWMASIWKCSTSSVIKENYYFIVIKLSVCNSKQLYICARSLIIKHIFYLKHYHLVYIILQQKQQQDKSK